MEIGCSNFRMILRSNKIKFVFVFFNLLFVVNYMKIIRIKNLVFCIIEIFICLVLFVDFIFEINILFIVISIRFFDYSSGFFVIIYLNFYFFIICIFLVNIKYEVCLIIFYIFKVF